MLPDPISWAPDGAVRLLDQTRLPAEEVYLELRTPEAMAEAIRMLRVRGAPLIGIAAAMGVTLAAPDANTTIDLMHAVERACALLAAARPTAVNLSWAVRRMRHRARSTTAVNAATLRIALVDEANAIRDEDRAMCAAIGAAGEGLIADGATVMTICNAGVLATGGIGTALAPIYRAHQAGRRVQVLAPETRPLLQGSRLTAWELSRSGIRCTVLTDGMVASRLARGDVSLVITGADRIAANGDTANKIGTYGVALLAAAHGVPFYVAAPRSTYDRATPSGAEITIEERAREEIAELGGRQLAPDDVAVWNPAFDVTPARLIHGYITDAGLLRAGDLGPQLAATRVAAR